MFSVKIDNRETEVIRLMKNVENPSRLNFESACLDHGDIHLLYQNKPVIIIERKTFSDVLASIHDGRWTEQKIRAMSSSDARLFYIIETGDIMWDHGITNTTDMIKNFSTVSVDSGLNAIINLFVVYNIPFLFVKNISMTVDIVTLFYRQLEKKRNDHDLQTSYEKSYIKSLPGIQSKKKENIDESMYYLHCLMGIPSVSHKTATQIKTLFPTFMSFMHFVKTHTESEFQELWKKHYDRKLNTKSIDFIYKLYTGKPDFITDCS